MILYDERFYSRQRGGSRRSAEHIVPLLLELVNPKSVVDVGCGVGTWLSVFQEYGVHDILGIDGSWVKKEMLQIPPEKFMAWDLTKPIKIERDFDLVISVEVAEHLPKDSAETFVETLVGLGPLVLFSAAVPFQCGSGHLNPQWPDFWAGLFEKRGYVSLDPLRGRIWNNQGVQFYYVQNMLLYAKKEFVEVHPKLKKEHERTEHNLLSVVHPSWYLKFADPCQMSLKRLLTVLPKVTVCTVRRVLNRLIHRC